MRINHKYAEVTGAKGINQQEDLADPRTELLDARNLWAPDGALVQRPGYRGIVSLPPLAYSRFADQPYTLPNGTSTASNWQSSLALSFATKITNANVTPYKETNPTVFTQTSTWSSLLVGHRLLFAIEDPALSGRGVEYSCCMLVDFQSAGSNGTNTKATPVQAGTFVWEYLSADGWKALPAVTLDSTIRKREGIVFGPTYSTYGGNNEAVAIVCFPVPRDLYTSVTADVTAGTVPVASRKYIRATLNETAFDSSVVQYGAIKLYGVASAQATARTTGVGVDGALLKFRDGMKLFGLFESAQSFDGYVDYTKSVFVCGDAFSLDTIWDTVVPASDRFFSMAHVPQFDEIFLSLSGAVYKLAADTADVETFGSTAIVAAVESDPLLVGDGAAYDADVVAQLPAFPAAKHITFYKGQLWAALENNSVRWSAPIPAHNVWPTLNIEVLPDNNNDPIQALIGFQENMHVFKPDSIWKFVDAGVSQFQLQTYAPVKVVSGTGLIAPKGYVVTDNGIFFMSQQGISFFDGVSVKVISDKIRGFIDRLSSSRLDLVRATHWRSKQCVLFAVSLDNSRNNNVVLVFDYKNGAWWVWDGFEVVGWLYDDSALERDALYFMDPYAGVHELGASNEDHGGTITSSFTTHALGDSETTKRFRDVEMIGQNLADSVDITLMTNDEAEAEGTDATIDFTDDLEAKWDTAVWDTDTWVADRARVRRIGFLESGNSVKVKVTHSEKNTPFEMTSMKVGMVPIGRRR